MDGEAQKQSLSDRGAAWVDTPAPAPTDSTPPATPPATPPPAAPPAGAATAAAAAAAGQTVEEYIEAQLEREPGKVEVFKIPKGARLPLKRKGETTYEPLEKVLTEGMMANDYRIRGRELQERVAAAETRERELARREARAKAQEEYFKEQDNELRGALTDPEKHERYLRHLDAMATNPTYRKMVEDAMGSRVTKAELEAMQDREDDSFTTSEANKALGYIEEMAQDPRFQGVDADRVRSIYARAFQAGELEAVDYRDIEQIFMAEAKERERILGPVTAQLTAMQAQIDALQGKKAADGHNANTDHAIRRGNAPPVNTGAGTPPGPPQVPPLEGRSLRERGASWVKR